MKMGLRAGLEQKHYSTEPTGRKVNDTSRQFSLWMGGGGGGVMGGGA